MGKYRICDISSDIDVIRGGFLYVPYKKNKILNITNKDNDIERVESPTESDGDTIESNIRTKSYKKALSKNDNSDEELKEFVELENKISGEEE